MVHRGRAALVAAGLTAVLVVPSVTLALSPQPVLKTNADEQYPAANDGNFLWTSDAVHPGRWDLFLRSGSGSQIQVNAPGSYGTGGGIDGNSVVYEQSEGIGNTFAATLMVYDIATGSRGALPITDSSFADMHPTISGDSVLYTRGISDHFTSVRLYSLAQHTARVLASGSGQNRSVYSGQVNGNWAVYERFGRTDSVYLYNIAKRSQIRIPRRAGVFLQYEPAVDASGDVFFVRNSPCKRRRCPGTSQIMERRHANGSDRVLATLRKHQNAETLFADQEPTGVDLYYERYRESARGNQSGGGDIYRLSVGP